MAEQKALQASSQPSRARTASYDGAPATSTPPSPSRKNARSRYGLQRENADAPAAVRAYRIARMADERRNPTLNATPATGTKLPEAADELKSLAAS